MKRKKKRIVKQQPIIENLGMNYTLDILPRTLEDNQFYYYDKKGVIRIGELLGVSKLSKIGVFKLGEQIIKRHIFNLQDDFKNGLIILDPYSGKTKYYCFNDYDNFVNAYNVSILKKKITSKKPVKYCVSSSSFFCRRTTQKLRDYKEFDNRADAVEYSRKGLITLFKNVKEFEEILNKASNELNSYFRDILHDNVAPLGLRKYEENFDKLNVGDNLLKVDFIHEYLNGPLCYHLRKVTSNTLTVSECIGHRDKFIRLNDGSLLLNEDCHAYNPFVFKEENYEEVKQILRINNILEVKRYIDSELRSLERVHRYCDVYEPFKKGVTEVWFSKFYSNAASKALPILVEKLKNNEI